MALLLMLLLVRNDAFIVDVSTERTYTVSLSREALRGYVDDIGLFARHMPGVVGVEPLGGNRYLYRTEKDVPLAGRLYTTFVITKSVSGDSVTTYRSESTADTNYMYCSVTIRPESAESTGIHIQLRLRLTRTSAAEIHWLAPLLGEEFIESRMREDMDTMLTEFIESSNHELYGTLRDQTLTGR